MFAVEWIRVLKVAEATAFARSLFILSALCFSEVGDGRIFCHDHPAAVVAPIHTLHCCFSLLLVLILNVNVSDHVVADVVGHHQLVDLSKL